jgi:hypothetical protein
MISLKNRVDIALSPELGGSGTPRRKQNLASWGISMMSQILPFLKPIAVHVVYV